MSFWAAAAPILGGIVGNMMSSGSRDASRDALERGWAELTAIGMPPDLSKRIIYERFQQMGILTPDLEEDISLVESKVSLIQEDPSLREGELQVLAEIQQRAKLGLGPEERLAVNDLRRDIGVESEAKRQQIMQSFASRGQGGSGSELISALQSGQGAAEEMNRQGDRIGAMAAQGAERSSDSAMDALSNIRNQDWNVASAKAGAADKFSLADFNAKNQRQTNNVGYQNQAQQYNLGQSQQIANMNTGQENQERLRMDNAKRDYWNDRLKRASAYAGQAQQEASSHAKEGERDSRIWSGVGSGIGTGIAGYNQEENSKTQNELNRQNALDIADKRYS
tara:strand:+ start:4980 stop:5990 length:1011 start_codon:yes stop_codon:yes gene_type:complete